MLPTIEEIASAQRERRGLISRTAATLDYLNKMVSESRVSEMAAEIITAHPYVRFMTVKAYEFWGDWILEIDDVFDKDGNSIKKQSHIRSTIQDLLCVSDEIKAFEPYSGKKIDLYDLSTRTYV